MPVRLRLAMQGRRNNRSFRLVAIDHRKRRDAKPLETLGVYNHRVGSENNDKPIKTMEWSVDRIKYWLGVGAQPSKPVVKLLEMVRVLLNAAGCLFVHAQA
jgi:small subunit ribosomal protein S16